MPRRFPGFLLAVCLAACAGKAPPIPEPAPPGEGELTLFLIGDAGESRPGGDPVLLALSSEIAGVSGRSIAVFLGDNIYPRGLPSEEASDRKEMERRLLDQVEAVKGADRALFVPGNHDWDTAGKDGWSSMLRQNELVRKHGDEGRVVVSPRDACPGPEVIELGSELTLITLDTAWWLHGHERPGPENCDTGTEEAVLRKLRDSLASKQGRHAVVVSHHPLLSSGPHGGYFGWQDHLFPLSRLHDLAWLPLPGIGSLYPLIRNLGVTAQDLSSSEYQAMREALVEACRDNPPLAFAGGHEHTLEALKGDVVPNLLVSGAGFYGHTNA
ncbi:MAG TPA: metallophosphoesterase, partial [Vicinamibacteria bacterium]|nr:metallophosphoesterase [Vicinamibacteria bacterium]